VLALHFNKEARLLKLDPLSRTRHAGALWFLLAAIASVAGSVVGRLAGVHSTDPAFPFRLLLLTGAQLGPVITGLAVWKIVRCRADAWLLPLAALNLGLLEPGRAADVTTWRLEWAVGGTIVTVVVVALFSRLLARTDELQRHIYIDGAAIGLLMALPVAMAYALFERWLPGLRAQWVTMALLLLWWAGWRIAAFRYR
jgi:hypothetical protein